MIAGKNLENFGGPLTLGIFNNVISFQDTTLLLLNQCLVNNIINKQQKDFVIQNNKEFYDKFKTLYKQNIALKSKLCELTAEKKKLKNIIINLDKKLKNNNLLDKENKENNNNKINDNTPKISPYRKRYRRRKSEIINNYECSFPNCCKKYLTKCSLNMHIKLKHQMNE